jgi:hypothetical protein
LFPIALRNRAIAPVRAADAEAELIADIRLANAATVAGHQPS